MERIGLLLRQAKAADSGAVNGREIGVVGLVAWISRLSKLFGGKGMNDADLEPGLGEGALNYLVIAPVRSTTTTTSLRLC